MLTFSIYQGALFSRWPGRDAINGEVKIAPGMEGTMEVKIPGIFISTWVGRVVPLLVLVLLCSGCSPPSAINDNMTYEDVLILDLDGNGVETIRVDDSAYFGMNTYFDMNTDGFAEHTGWLSGNDGILALDVNGNGMIDDGAELLSDQMALSGGGYAADGYDALSSLDDNNDGVIDASDAIYPELLVWQDQNGKGISESGELYTLEDLGIVSIDLNPSYHTVNLENGNINAATGSYTMVDGNVGQTGKYLMETDTLDPIPLLDIEIPDHYKSLPDLRNSGVVYTLHQAMTLDESGELGDLVFDFMYALYEAEQYALIDPIIERWAGVADVEPDSRGSNINARQLAVVEKITGDVFIGVAGPNPTAEAAPFLQDAYEKIRTHVYNELSLQTDMQWILDETIFTKNEDGYYLIQWDSLMSAIDNELAYDPNDGYARVYKLLSVLQEQLSTQPGYEEFLAELSAKSGVFKILVDTVAAKQNMPYRGYNLGDKWDNIINATGLIFAGGGDDIISAGADSVVFGGPGDDSITGGNGNQTYVFNPWDGQDTITDNNNGAVVNDGDKITLGEWIAPEDIILTQSGNDLLLKMGSDQITIKNHFSNYRNQIEQIVFADGTVWDQTSVAWLLSVGGYVPGTIIIDWDSLTYEEICSFTQIPLASYDGRQVLMLSDFIIVLQGIVQDNLHEIKRSELRDLFEWTAHVNLNVAHAIDNGWEGTAGPLAQNVIEQAKLKLERELAELSPNREEASRLYAALHRVDPLYMETYMTRQISVYFYLVHESQFFKISEAYHEKMLQQGGILAYYRGNYEMSPFEPDEVTSYLESGGELSTYEPFFNYNAACPLMALRYFLPVPEDEEVYEWLQTAQPGEGKYFENVRAFNGNSAIVQACANTNDLRQAFSNLKLFPFVTIPRELSDTKWVLDSATINNIVLKP
jgi:hypothetical protein